MRSQGIRKVLQFGMLVLIFVLFATMADAQCSICTRTAEQMGEKPARELNFGILYLALTPLALIGFIAFKWIRKNRSRG